MVTRWLVLIEEVELATKTDGTSISDEYEDVRERIEQKIRDIDKSMAKLTKEKAELEALLKKQ